MHQARPRRGRAGLPPIPGRTRQAHLRERLQGSLAGLDQAPDHAHQREQAEPCRPARAEISRRTDGEAFLRIRSGCGFGLRAAGQVGVLLPGDGPHAGLGPEQEYVRPAPGEQSVGNDAGDIVDRRFQLDRVEDGQAPHVEDDVAVVGGKALAQLGLAAELNHLARHIGTRHWNHLDRQRKFSKHRHELRLVRDADELFRHRGDDFLPRERAAPALDHCEMLGDLVRAVDVDRQLVDAVEIQDANAVTLQPLGGSLRTRHCASDAILHLGQLVDEEIGGGSGADADHGVLHHVLDRLAGDCLLELVLGHRRFDGGRSVHTPSYSSAAIPTDSLVVGCGWMVLPISTASAPISIASAISLMRSPAPAPTMAPPITRCVSSEKISLVKPSSRPLAMARPEAVQGNFATPNLTPCFFASSSVSPAQAISGSVYATEGMTRASKWDFWLAAASAATCPSWTALCA